MMRGGFRSSRQGRRRASRARGPVGGHGGDGGAGAWGSPGGGVLGGCQDTTPSPFRRRWCQLRLVGKAAFLVPVPREASTATCLTGDMEGEMGKSGEKRKT